MDAQIENLKTGKHKRIYKFTKLSHNKKLYAPTENTNTRKYAFKINGLLTCKRTSIKTIIDNIKAAKLKKEYIV
jgi:hypothetical protein